MAMALKTPSLEEIEKRVRDSYEIPNHVLQKVEKPLVTIRTSTFNHKAYIEKCIEGVLMQKTDFPFEYIIGEDFSSDGTREIVMAYAQKYPEIIRVLTADYNVGSKANGRRCILASRGEYIAMCEGDDYWNDDCKLQKQIDALRKHPEIGFCFHPANQLDIFTGETSVVGNLSQTSCVFSQNKMIILGGGKCPTASIVYKRKYAPEILEFAKSAPGGDYIIQVICSEKGALYLNEKMATYRFGAPNSWTSRIKTDFEHRERTREKIMKTLETLEGHLPSKAQKALSYRKAAIYVDNALLYSKEGHLETAKQLIRKSLNHRTIPDLKQLTLWLLIELKAYRLLKLAIKLRKKAF